MLYKFKQQNIARQKTTHIHKYTRYVDVIRKDLRLLPEHACGGNGNISVVELFRLATAQPNDCGLKLRSCCMKSEHSMRATSAKCKSHKI